MMDKVAEQLRRYDASQGRYPAFTAEELYRRGAFDGETIRFLRSKKVEYFPFSSADPPEKLILRVRLSKQQMPTLLKTDLAPRAAE